MSKIPKPTALDKTRLYPVRFEPIYEYRLGAVVWSAQRHRDGAGTGATTADRPGAGELGVGSDPALRPSTPLVIACVPDISD